MEQKEIKYLSEQEITECLETYHKMQKREKKRNRLKTWLFFGGLVVLYLYLRLFNTAIEVSDDSTIWVKYSTAWIVNCPGNLFKGEPEYGTGHSVSLHGIENFPYMRVLNVGEGVKRLNANFDISLIESRNVKLHTVKLPSTLEEIYEGFENCVSLKTVIWEKAPEGSVIGKHAFSNTGIEQITIPEGVVLVNDNAFAFNEHLKKVTLPDSIEFLGKRVFAGCSNLEEVTLSNLITDIPRGTFAGCNSLVQINNVDSVKNIGFNALTGTLIDSEQIPDNVYYYFCKQFSDVVYYYFDLFDETDVNYDENPWLENYSYTYYPPTQEEIINMSEQYNIPMEAFEIPKDSGRFWLDGKYYRFGMTFEEFLSNDDWLVDTEYKNEDGTYTVYIENGNWEGNRVRLVLDENAEVIIQYYFEGGKSCVVLPQGIHNLGTSPEMAKYFYGSNPYTLYYKVGGIKKEATVQIENPGYYALSDYCDIFSLNDLVITKE